jgi:ribonuclease Z
MMQTMASNKYDGKLKIFGPISTTERMKNLMAVFPFESPIDFDTTDIPEGCVFENSEFRIIAKRLEHSIECMGYRFEEKDKLRIDKTKMKKLGLKEGPHLMDIINGKTLSRLGKKISPQELCFTRKGKVISYISDTGLCEGTKELARDADLVICESTYASKHIDKTEKYLHLTSEQAAMIASQSNAKELILTHFSQRYNDVSELLSEAKSIFPNTKAAFDLMKIKL